MRDLAGALAAAIVLNATALTGRPASYAPPLALSAETAVQSAGLLSVGMRRLAADLELIRLLVYYGTAENEKGEEEHEHGHESHDPAHPELSWGGGRYPEMGPRARRALALDSSFNYPVLYAAGALAFNLNRPDEALGLLEEGLRADPHSLKFRAYIGAIGFHRRGDVRRVLELLEPTLQDPDCPTMIKSMVAFMYKRAGRREDAVRLYRDIVGTTRDEGYRNTARRMLRELGLED